jgi:hypothetical protein
VQAALLNVPRSEAEWNIWAFNHRVSHDTIRAGIAAKGGPALADYQIDPIPPQAMPQWLQDNQQLHIDMNSALGQQSSDLQDVDLSDERQLIAWIAIHYQEHFDAEVAAGVSS